MERPYSEKDTPLETILKLVVLGVIVGVFTYMAFINEQPCDAIDKVNFWCRVHPMKIFDWIGAIGFYAGALLISGLTKIRIWNNVGSVATNFIWAGAMLASLLMMYFL